MKAELALYADPNKAAGIMCDSLLGDLSGHVGIWKDTHSQSLGQGPQGRAAAGTWWLPTFVQLGSALQLLQPLYQPICGGQEQGG